MLCRPSLTTLALTLILGSLASCSGDDGATPPTDCDTPGIVILSGTLDSQPLDEQLTGKTYTFENVVSAGTPGRLEIPFSDSGIDRLEIEFVDRLKDGQSVGARGFVNLSEQGGIVAGNCSIESFVSTISLNDTGDGGTFVLRALHAEPFCSGRQFDGMITGCFHAPQN